MNIRFIIHCTDDTQIQKKSQPKQQNPLLHSILGIHNYILWIVFFFQFLYKTSFDIAIRKMQFGQSIRHFFNHRSVFFVNWSIIFWGHHMNGHWV